VSTPPHEEIQGMRRQSKNAGSGFSLNSLSKFYYIFLHILFKKIF